MTTQTLRGNLARIRAVNLLLVCLPHASFMGRPDWNFWICSTFRPRNGPPDPQMRAFRVLSSRILCLHSSMLDSATASVLIWYFLTSKCHGGGSQYTRDLGQVDGWLLTVPLQIRLYGTSAVDPASFKTNKIPQQSPQKTNILRWLEGVRYNCNAGYV